MRETRSPIPSKTQPATSAGARPSLFTTCPESRDTELRRYREIVRAGARDSEAAGAAGMLVYAENRLVDPWLVSQIAIEATRQLAPLVAVQPAYSHPYTVAKQVSTLTNLYGRPVWLNLIAGGFRNDLTALGDQTEHDDRYRRLEEFGQIVAGLCRGEAVTLHGRYYDVRGLRLLPEIEPGLQPRLMVSGSSPAGLALAQSLSAVAVRYPLPPGEEPEARTAAEIGIRVGIIARADREDAWGAAVARFPPERTGQIAYGFAMRASDSHWHRRLSAAEAGAPGDSPYWLGPFRNYQSFCPYLVGSYDEVAGELARYVSDGARTVILDISDSAELSHSARCFTQLAA